MEARKGRGYVYALEYHIVWCTKYRRKVLSGPVEIRLKELLSTLAKENETAILEMEVMEDHVHLLIQASPQVFLGNQEKGSDISRSDEFNSDDEKS